MSLLSPAFKLGAGIGGGAGAISSFLGNDELAIDLAVPAALAGGLSLDALVRIAEKRVKRAEEKRLEVERKAREREKIIRRDAALEAGEKPRHAVAARTPKWIRDTGQPYHLPEEKARLERIKKLANDAGKDHDHNIPRRGSVASGLDVPDNVSAMDKDLNRKVKGNRLPDDFLDFEWKRNPRTGRMTGYRRVKDSAGVEKLQRVPRSQGGFASPELLGATPANAERVKNFLKGAGKVGLLGAAEMGLNYFAPDNPINQARKRGNKMMSDLGFTYQDDIEDIENNILKIGAMLGEGIFLDPFVTALGAGANVGDRLYGEITGENIRPNITRQGPGLAGRFNPQGML